MDHEYSISGRLWVDNVDSVLLSQDCREYTLGDIVFLLSTTTAKEIQIILKDKSTAVSISDDKIIACCTELSRKFVCRVRIEKLHEEYGNANVFNGGSDYEVGSADRFVCEYLNGKEVSRSRTQI